VSVTKKNPLAVGFETVTVTFLALQQTRLAAGLRPSRQPK